jgi:hypothetical protein
MSKGGRALLLGKPGGIGRPPPSWRNTATALISQGFLVGVPQHDPPHRPQRIRWCDKAESGQCDRGLWPGGNTAPETTLLSGYGVDTLRWADNVAAPGAAEVAALVSFKGGSPAGAREQRRAGGHLRRCSSRGLGPARLARSNSIHAVGRHIVETSCAIAVFRHMPASKGQSPSVPPRLLSIETTSH